MLTSMFQYKAILFISAICLVTGDLPTAQQIALEKNAMVVSGITSKFSINNRPPMHRQINAECEPEDMSCADDQLTVCGLGRKKITVPCSSLFENKAGYCDCDNVQCVATRPRCFDPKETKCNTPGEKMPDPANCHQFTYCDESGEKNTLRCLLDMVYNATTEKCENRGSCVKVFCNQRKVLEWVPYRGAPQYYLFCSNGIGEMRKCSKEGYGMENGKCQFQCTAEGAFQDPEEENCRKGMWHVCIRRGNLFIKMSEKCENINGIPHYFDEKIGVCTKKDTCSAIKDLPQIDEEPGIEKTE